MTDDVVWKHEDQKNKSNINKIRQFAMTDENATNIEKMQVVTLTEIHDQLWWLALLAKMAIGLLVFQFISMALWLFLFV